jgi:hypothetical protein
MKISDKTRTAIKPDGTRIPVIDGKFSFLIEPTKEDIENAVKGDHTQCMYACACRRLYHSGLVWITRTLAYVELKNKKGEPELRRFILKDPARHQVKGFDKGEYATEEAVIFARPEGAYRLDAIAAESRQRSRKARRDKKSKVKKSAYVKGEAAGSGSHHLEPLAGALRDPASGMFHFQ